MDMPTQRRHNGFVSFMLPADFAGKEVTVSFNPSDGSDENVLHKFTALEKKPSPELALPTPLSALSRTKRASEAEDPPFSRWDAHITCQDVEMTIRGICVFADVRSTLDISETVDANLAPPSLRFGSEVCTSCDNDVTEAEETVTQAWLPDYYDIPYDRCSYPIPRSDYNSAYLSRCVYPSWNRCGFGALSILLNSLLLRRRCCPRPYCGYDDYFYPVSLRFDTLDNAVKETLSLYAIGSDGKPVDVGELFSDSEKLWYVNSLAEFGNSPLDIIKKLYGDACKIVSLEKSQDKVVFAPKKAKKDDVISSPGDNGVFVMVLRNNINKISRNIAFVPAIPPKGSFDEALKKSVEAFQKYCELPSTGCVDKVTWEKISATVKSIDNGWLFDYPGYELGIEAKCSDVKRLKSMLLFLKKFIPSIRITDYSCRFDKDTEISLIRAQRKFDLLPTGRADRRTWERLWQEIKKR